MSDSTDPPDEHATAAPGNNDPAINSAETPTTTAAPAWRNLNRTNRILTIVLGSGLGVLIAAVVFGIGVVVGMKHGDFEERGDDHGYSEYRGDPENGPREHGGQEQDDARHDDDSDRESADGDRRGQLEQPADRNAPDDKNIGPTAAPGPPH